MTWNYRVIRTVYDIEGEELVDFSIHEVYYDTEGKAVMMTEDAVAPAGDTMEEFKDDLIHYMAALTKPVMEAAEIGSTA